MSAKNTASPAPEGQQQGTTGPEAATGTTDAATGQQGAEQQPQQAPEVTEDADDGKGGNKAGQEAARYRKQLRETEAERDTLRGTVDKLQRGIIAQNMPHGSKLNADALWKSGHSPADLFTADGGIDADKLTQAVKDTHQQFGLRFGPDPVTASGTGSREGLGQDKSWSDVLKGR